MKISLNWLRDFIKITPPYEKLAEDLTMAGLTVEAMHEANGEPRDVVFDVEITTNRPDWLSHWGVAREAAAVRNLSLKAPQIYTKTRSELPAGWSVDLRDAENCPYYSGVLIEGIPTAVETPAWMRDRLILCGIRPINFIVDVTNYVLLETGQPLHAFDANTIEGSKIKVRKAKAGEKFILIDGKEIELSPKDLVIADAKSPIALAGVMGGKTTEVTSSTRNVFLESGFFVPSSVRQSARRHGLKSESSYRFERRVDPEGVDFARNRALWLLMEHSAPHKVSVSGVLRAGECPLLEKKSIKLQMDQIKQLLGVSIKASEAMSILTRLGLSVSAPSSKSIVARPPSFRADLMTSCDLIEEIARIHGYHQIPETLPERAPLTIRDHSDYKLESFLRPRLAGLGFHETVTFSLISDKGIEPAMLERAIEIVNPQNHELRWMRPTLLTSLLNVLKKNADMGAARTFLFESANIYRQSSKDHKAEQEKVLGLLISGQLRLGGWLEAERQAGYHDLKGMVSAILRSLGISKASYETMASASYEAGLGETIKLDTVAVGRIGQVNLGLCKDWGIDQPVFYAEINLSELVKRWTVIKPLNELPRFPSIVRDLSIVVPEVVKAGELDELIKSLGRDLVKDVRVFDVFRGGRVPAQFKNLGISITYQSVEKTLLADDIQELHTSIASQIAQQYQATFQ